MVEFALTIWLFIVFVFAIMEFAILIFQWSLANEAARFGARYAIVNEVADLDSWDCSDAPDPLVINLGTCTSSTCSAMLSEMQKLSPLLEGNNVQVTYTCSDAGNPELGADKLSPEVTVSLQNVTYNLILPQVLGFDANMSLPPFHTTRVGEDLHTPGT